MRASEAPLPARGQLEVHTQVGVAPSFPFPGQLSPRLGRPSSVNRGLLHYLCQSEERRTMRCICWRPDHLH